MDDGDEVLEIFLQPGELYFGEENTRVRTVLGSCVAMTLWHPRLRIGGMCHYMLPSRPGGEAGEALDGRYADEAVQLFMRQLRSSRTWPADFQVKLFGGGNMFARQPGGSRLRHMDVSERNVEAGRALLKQHGFRLTAEDLGGVGHRNVMLELWSGDVWVKH